MSQPSAPRRLIAFASAAIVALFIVAGCSAPSSSSTARSSAKITSTIRNGAKLDAPVVWTANVATPPGQSVKSVNFTVDGKVEWTVVHGPVQFNGANNLLLPWVLGGGKHMLGIVANMNSGPPASTKFDVTIAGTSAPTDLVGKWTRTVALSDFPSGTQDGTPVGPWTMALGKNGLILMNDSQDGLLDEAFTATTGHITFYGAANWLVPVKDQDGFCDSEPPGVYTWQRSGSTLTLTNTSDLQTCPDRAAVFNGVWTSQPD
jgi:hypothetical protein